MNTSLQSLRSIFAIMIFLHHFPHNGNGLFLAGGPLGTCFFLMLSGFVMSISYGQKVLSENFEFKYYFIKRLIKLLPLHILCLLVYIVLYHQNCFASIERIGALVINALLLQSWIPLKGIYFSGNAVSWYLCDCIFCYLMFPLLFRLSNRIRTSILTICVSCFAILYFVVIQTIPNNLIHAFVYISPLFRLFDFILGIYAYRIYILLCEGKISHYLQNSTTIKLTTIEICLLALLCGYLLACRNIDIKYVLVSLWWPICFLLILLFALFDKYGGGAFHTFIHHNALLQKLSTITFSFYMIHGIAITAIFYIFNSLPFDLPLLFQLIICLCFSIFAAALVNNYFEKPISAYLIRCVSLETYD